jgi:hypothetical protein
MPKNPWEMEWNATPTGNPWDQDWSGGQPTQPQQTTMPQQEERGWYDRVFGVQKTAPQFADPNMPKPGTLTIGAPQGLLRKFWSKAESNLTDQQINTLNRVVSTGQLLGLNDPMTVLGPGKETGGRIVSKLRDAIIPSLELPTQGPTRSLLNRVQQYRGNVNTAKNIVSNAPVKRAELIEQRVEPLLQKKEELVNTRSVVSARNAEEKANVVLNKQKSLEGLKTATEEATIKTKADIESQIKSFNDSIGPVVRQTEIQKGVSQADALKYRLATDQSSAIYTEISDLAKDNILPITKTTPKVGILGSDGQQAYSTVTNNVSGPMDNGILQTDPKLQGLYNVYRDAIGAAASKDSPIAKIIKDVMEGPKIIDYDTARKNLETLNGLGYGKNTDAFRDVPQSLARMIAGKYRTALRQSVSQWENGGDEAVRKLDIAAGILDERSKTLIRGSILNEGKTAKKAISRIKEKGNVIGMLNDPAAFHGLMSAVLDTPVENQIRSTVTRHIMSAKDINAKWSGIAPEIKEVLYTPEQIANIDAMAKDGPKRLLSIVEESDKAKKAIIENARKAYADLAKERRQLSQLTQQRTSLSQKVRSERNAIKAEIDKEVLRAKETLEKNAVLRKRIALTATGAAIVGWNRLGGNMNHATSLIMGGQ